MKIIDIINVKLKDFLLNYWLFKELYTNSVLKLIDLDEIIINVKREIFNLLETVDNIEEVAIKDVLYNLTDIKENDIEQTKDIILSSFERLNPDFNLNTDKPMIIEREIDKIFSQIRNIESFYQADIYFDLLDKIQILTCKLTFNDRIKLNEKLCKFIADYDRLDDVDTRKFLFNKVKVN